jgi:hypothetical protein
LALTKTKKEYVPVQKAAAEAEEIFFVDSMVRKQPVVQYVFYTGTVVFSCPTNTLLTISENLTLDLGKNKKREGDLGVLSRWIILVV